MSTTAAPTYTLGAFVWRELLTRDVAAAKAFYGGLFGWTFEDMEMGPGMTYALASVGEERVAGFMDLADLPGASEEVPAHWGTYVSVADVDAKAQEAVALGGKICLAPHDIPGVGRFAMVMDPLGATVHVYRCDHGDPEDRPARVGEFCWESLSTPDAAASKAFYTQLFGWTTSPMGEETTIFEFAGKDGPDGIASMGPSPDGGSRWTPFVKVVSVAATAAKAQELGAEVVVERMDISPEVGAFGVLQDPTGAFIFTFEGPQGA